MNEYSRPMSLDDIRGSRQIVGHKASNSRQKTRPLSVSELPQVIDQVDRRLTEIQRDMGDLKPPSNLDVIAAINRLGERFDGLTSELHTMTILLSQLVAFQTYVFDTETLNSDARDVRIDAVTQVRAGD